MIPVFYDPRQNVFGLDSYSPSAGKPARLIELLQHFEFHNYGPDMLGSVVPVTKQDLYRVHSHDYVDGVFSLREPNGHGNVDPRVPESCLWTIGSLLAASRHAIKNPTFAACSPTSGYHHSGWDFGGGYCTFNGLMVVAAKLIEENPGMKVAILDCDMHAADGTMAILKKFPGLKDSILHITQGPDFYGDNPKQEALEFVPWLIEAIEEINAFKPDLVIYQAGADPHIKDPLGGFLNDDELYQRDSTVFRNIKAPIVWTLAGGYQKSTTIFDDPVLAIHRRTILAAERSTPTRKEIFA